MAFALPNSKQKGRMVAEVLRRAILVGELKPGERLRELAMAEKFQTSQGPIREAFRILSGEDLVVQVPNRGTYVASIDKGDVVEAYNLRVTIEARAVRLAMASWTAERTAALEAALGPMAVAAKRADHVALADADLGFHRTLCEFAERPVLLKAWTDLAVYIRRYKTLSDQMFWSDPEAIVDTHIPVMEAIRSGDPAKAEDVLRSHILFAANSIADGDGQVEQVLGSAPAPNVLG